MMNLNKEKKQFLIFLGIGGILGFILSTFFFFLASYQKVILNSIAVLILLLIFFRSFYQLNKKCTETTFFKRILFITPKYFSVLNLIFLVTIFVPNALKTKSPVFFILSAVSLIFTALFITGIILKKNSIQKGINHHGENS